MSAKKSSKVFHVSLYAIIVLCMFIYCCLIGMLKVAMLLLMNIVERVTSKTERTWRNLSFWILLHCNIIVILRMPLRLNVVARLNLSQNLNQS